MISKFILKITFGIAMKVISTIVWLIMILSAYGGRVDPNISSIPATLTLALPYFAGISILLLIFWIFRHNILFSILGGLAIVACISPLSRAFPLSFPKNASGGDTTLKLMTWNIIHTWDIREPDSPGNPSVSYLMKSGADVICMQELLAFDKGDIRHYTKAMMDSLFKIYPYHVGDGYNDLKVLSKYPIEDIIPEHFPGSDFRQRFDAYKLDVNGHALTIVNVHLTSFFMDEKDSQFFTMLATANGFEKSMALYRSTLHAKLSSAFRMRDKCARVLREYLDTLKGDIIVCGDFNDVPESWAYRIVRGDDFRDAYSATSFGPTFTYNKHLLYFHIDQILYKGPGLKALNVKRGKIKTSDHYPMIAEFKLD